MDSMRPWHPVIVLTIVLLCGVVFLGGFAVGSHVTRPPSHRFTVFAGGDPDNAFAQAIANGARTAAADLGVQVELVWSGFDSERMARQFAEVVARKPDGIALMGHPGESILAPLIEDADRAGIRQTVINVDLPNIEARLSARGFGYAGQDIRRSGGRRSQAAIRAYDLKPGQRALVIAMESIPIRGERGVAAREALRAAGLVVDTIQGGYDRAARTTEILAYIREHPDVRLILDDAEVVETASHLQAAGIGPDAYRIVGFDLMDGTVPLLQSGMIDFVAVQQPFLQGYLAVHQLAMTCRYGFAGQRTDTGTAFFHAGNLDTVAARVELGRY
jgi:simple sugar transport system substrate-binding protein